MLSGGAVGLFHYLGNTSEWPSSLIVVLTSYGLCRAIALVLLFHFQPC